MNNFLLTGVGGGGGATADRALGVFSNRGGSTDPATRLAAYKAVVPVDPAIWHVFQSWSEALFTTDELATATGIGATLQVTWEPTSVDLTTIPAGAYDATIDAAATLAAAASPTVIYLRFAHEFNGDWTTWGQAHYTAAQYVAAWQYIHGRFAAATNVRWVWCPNVLGGTSVVDPTDWYPGDEYVDIVGMDGYTTADESIGTIFTATYDLLTALVGPSRPFQISEIGDAPSTGKDAWILQAFLGDIPILLPRVQNVIYFDSDDTAAGNSNWLVDSSPGSGAAFVRVAQSELWSAKASTSIPAPYELPADTSTTTNTAEGGAAGSKVVAALSGGESGRHWDAIRQATPATITYDDAQAAHGVLSHKFTQGASLVENTLVWNLDSPSEVYGRLYGRFPAFPAGNQRLVRFYQGSNICGGLTLGTAGKFYLLNSTSNAGPIATAIPVDAWWRVDFRIQFLAAGATGELRLFIDPEGTTPADVLSVTGQNYLGAPDSVRVGLMDAGSANSSFWLDDIEIVQDATGWADL